jgi:porphobilinogen synthase
MNEIQPYTFKDMSFKRFRPLRKDVQTRDRLAEVHLSANDFILPYFVVEGKGIRNEIGSLKDVYHLSVDSILKEIEEPIKLGINKFLLFGVVEDSRKDETGSFSASAVNPVNRAIQEIKKVYPDITIITDVCLCAYTSHGHCGILDGEHVENDKTLPILAEMALSNAKAGANIVAPSAMMDGQVWAIRQLLDKNGFSDVKILSYSAKYSSGLYGPFRGAANSKPAFGDRKTYQMDYRVASQAIDEMAADIDEGADYLMVKPAHTYLDIISTAHTKYPEVTLAAYHVSGEYMMLKSAAQAGIVEERHAVLEVFTAIRRAGANWIISYYAPFVAKLLKS